MQNRRSFLQFGLFAAGAAGSVPGSIQKALAISADPGTTYLDAEHIVILMQENRSFDHMFGTLRGVRGFNDRRVLRQADGASVFIQRDGDGSAYLPWHVSLKDTKIAWMGSLPHGRPDHLDALNGGTCNNWISAKRSAKYPDIPLTMAYHTRADLPFYYALADAFTVCDQNFCSSLTGTAPNRLHLWAGTIREQGRHAAISYLHNETTHAGALNIASFPERLENAGIGWKFYQNDSWCESPLSHAPEAVWLGNDGDNTVERFRALKSEFSPSYRAYATATMDKLRQRLLARKERCVEQLARAPQHSAEVARLRQLIAAYDEQLARNIEKRENGRFPLASLNERERAFHDKVITSNSGDPDYRTLQDLDYQVDGKARTIAVPKGDVLHQFRKDVREDKLPAISWLVAPANFSAHPGAPFFGEWYVSEIIDILTERPDVWKKTIFILTFDENDGFFDHVPPFLPPRPEDPESGKVSPGIDPAVEHVDADHELLLGTPEENVRDGPIGLGYRVPMIVASPWSRGGWVNSQLFDHSSIIRFIETFAAEKWGKDVTQSGISAWRRTVSGDLTSCFRRNDGKDRNLSFIERDAHIGKVAAMRDKPVPGNFIRTVAEAYAAPAAEQELLATHLWQEKGVRHSCALPYEMNAQGRLSADARAFELEMQAGNALFGARAAGVPYNLYLRGAKQGSDRIAIAGVPSSLAAAHYLVKAGDVLRDSIALDRFAGNVYDIELFGPNGFYRRFAGDVRAPAIAVTCAPRVKVHGSEQASLLFGLVNPHDREIVVDVHATNYRSFRRTLTLPPRGKVSVEVPAGDGHRWYEIELRSKADPRFRQVYAGRIETGRPSVSDPAMGLRAG